MSNAGATAVNFFEPMDVPSVFVDANTIAEKLAQEFDTVWMPEYGREYWETHHIDRRLTLEQLTEITHRPIPRMHQSFRMALRLIGIRLTSAPTPTSAIRLKGIAQMKLMPGVPVISFQ